ncbi:6-carboxytetrahydropterin synthase [Hydrogenophaga pseudoflava]|uniref:6-carboxytetrahydropterin synthase n=1 Tax=Hydrogenophaga pseudoflava TaxID=47421 RepID=UPI0027E58A22|nr:6-carboxytetrahydropterin synthase [Hydrogenophaga pseudoflava]MDQ7744825.1 6-carboxytetrahydropterin synthase [Hydrogenophaga pseudoflava]
MLFSVSQRFFFDAAHTLRRAIDTESSLRIHGHTYHAEVVVTGARDGSTGMVIDLGLLRRELVAVREALDHHLLDEVPDLGTPTLENLCVYIAARLAHLQPPVSRVRVWREALGDACSLELTR